MSSEEETNIMESRSFQSVMPNKVLPAAGRPAAAGPVPSSRRGAASVRPPPASSARNVGHEPEASEDDEGRTVVRGAPKIVKRTKSVLAPTSMSPASVKATVDSTMRARRDQLLPGPPADLLEDRADFIEPARPAAQTPFARSAPPPANFEGPPSRPPPGWGAMSAAPYAATQRSGPISGYPSAPAPSSGVGVPVSPASVPAHFMTPQAPYSDPPGTSVTAGYRATGRPAVSWAAALLAFGVVVGVAAVAVVQGNEAAAETTASFVDPSRTPSRQHPAAAQPALTPVPVTPNGVPAAGGVIGASPVPAAPPEGATPTPAAPTAVVAAGGVLGGFAPVAVPSGAAAKDAPREGSSAKEAKEPKEKKASWKAAPITTIPKKESAKTAAASSDDEPPKPAPRKKAAAEPDDETKKALEQLRKAQLESASSFGKE